MTTQSVTGQQTTVFSGNRLVSSPQLEIAPPLYLNKRLRMDGITLLAKLPNDAVPVVFFDPQYRGVLDKLQYGNEGKNRGRRRSGLTQMNENMIIQFIAEIDRVLIPSGHLFLWMDKFHLCSGFHPWINGTALNVVDLISWHKGKIGMGYRTRRTTEYCVALQKSPQKAKGVWTVHNIPDTWQESIPIGKSRRHTHQKPQKLQAALLEAVTNEGDVVLDPAAGSFVVMDAAWSCRRQFLGCDINCT